MRSYSHPAVGNEPILPFPMCHEGTTWQHLPEANTTAHLRIQTFRVECPTFNIEQNIGKRQLLPCCVWSWSSASCGIYARYTQCKMPHYRKGCKCVCLRQKWKPRGKDTIRIHLLSIFTFLPLRFRFPRKPCTSFCKVLCSGTSRKSD